MARAASTDMSVAHFSISTKSELPPEFDTTRLFSVQVPSSEVALTTDIAEDAFSGCSGLTSVALPEGVAMIGEYAFAECSGLSSVILPKSLIEIGGDAFGWCSGLTSIVLPDGGIVIGESAFECCSELASVILPKNLTDIRGDAFGGCSNLARIAISEVLPKLGCKPSNHNCSGLTAIKLPKGVTEIDYYAFLGCSSLTCVALPGGLSAIPFQAFGECSWLVVVTLHSPLPMTVSPDAFASCGRLRMVVAPRASGLVGASFKGVVVVEDTEANRRCALDLQHWRVRTHGLCSPRRRSWVRTVLLVANRLLGGPLTMPHEMWYAILEAIQRCDLGPAP